LLVAARNFQSAWLMRSLGAQQYRDWHVERIQETNITDYLVCLFAQTGLTALVGTGIIYFSDGERELVPVLPAIGLGIIAYAMAVAVFTLLGVVRVRRASMLEERRVQDYQLTR